ncbi:MAG: family 1 glycosylhydrolase [Candidatus Dormibacteria bacterium]
MAPAEGTGRIELLGSFESTYQPEHDVDVSESNQHDRRWAEDLELLRSCSVSRLRYPIRWHRIEQEEGRLDWAATDAVLDHMRRQGLRPTVDLLHHTSYPRWLTGGFADPRFGVAYLRFLEEFARRYPWIEEYTLFNEPFTTLFLCGHEGIFPPRLSGMDNFLRLVRNVFPTLTAGSRLYRSVLPQARHVYVDTCERHSAGDPAGEAYMALANDRRFFLQDLFLGRPLERDRPFVRQVVAGGGEDVLGIEPGHIDVLGLDYYAHSQWQFLAWEKGVNSSPTPDPLADLIVEYWERYRLPCMLGETNIRGFVSDRASWFKHTLEQCEIAASRGVPIDGYCWFPFVDSCDWDSLLARADRHIDPVGVYWLDGQMNRHPSSMSRAFGMVASGATSADLPAYRFRPPVSDWLRGFLPFMSHWDWQPPPPGEVCSNAPVPGDRIEFRIVDAGE